MEDVLHEQFWWAMFNIVFPSAPLFALLLIKKVSSLDGTEARKLTEVWAEVVADGQLCFYAAAITVASMSETLLPAMKVSPFFAVQLILASVATVVFAIFNTVHNVGKGSSNTKILCCWSNWLAGCAVVSALGNHIYHELPRFSAALG